MEEGVTAYDIIGGRLGSFAPMLPVNAGHAGELSAEEVEAHLKGVSELLADGRPIYIGWAVASGDKTAAHLTPETPRRAFGVSENWRVSVDPQLAKVLQGLADEWDMPNLVMSVMALRASQCGMTDEARAWADTPDGRAAIEMGIDTITLAELAVGRAHAQVCWGMETEESANIRNALRAANSKTALALELEGYEYA
jgi:hypothetical protein